MKTRYEPLLVAVGLLLGTGVGTAAEPLPALGADLSGLTVSGLSSGGYMATQFQIAHSSLVSGAGLLASGPYDCAQASLVRAQRNCMAPDRANPPPAPEHTAARMKDHARAGRIDPIEGLRDDRVWVLSGELDRTVERPVVDALVAFYRAHIEGDAVRYVTLAEAGHAMISVAAPEGNACATSSTPFINRCGNFDAPGELLTHLLGPLQPRVAAPADNLHRFAQATHTQPWPTVDLSMADEGFVYVPSACKTGSCKVHVAFHGCRQGEGEIGLAFVEGSGYNEWAEANRIIVLYPQVRPRSGFAWGSWRWVYNPKGCWDWWGYSGSLYPTRDGGQIRAVHSMLQQLAQPAATMPD